MIVFLERALYFILVLGSLVFIHELGHYLVAKLFGIRVETFSLGFGPRLVGFRKGETEYRLAIIPLGGYCRMAGEYLDLEDAEEPPDPALLTSKPRWQRLLVSFGGPAMNLLLALGLWWGLFMVGSELPDLPEGPPIVDSVKVGSPADQAGIRRGDRIVALGELEIDSIEAYGRELLFSANQTLLYGIERAGEHLEVEVHLAKHPIYGIGIDGLGIATGIVLRQVVEGSPAARAGLQPGDQIIAVDGTAPPAITDLVDYIRARADTAIAFQLERAGKRLSLEVTPERREDGTGLVGVVFGRKMHFVRYAPGPAFLAALGEARSNVALLGRVLSALFHRRLGVEVVSGPLEIARVSYDQAQSGLRPFLQLMAVISIQLGIFNLLPIPVLDGGTILVLLIESTLRRDISPKIKERILQVGFVLLILFAVTVISLDIRKAFLVASPAAAERPAAADTEPDGR